MCFKLVRGVCGGRPIGVSVTNAVRSVSRVAGSVLCRYCRAFCRPDGVLLFVIKPISPSRVVSRIQAGRDGGSCGRVPRVGHRFRRRPTRTTRGGGILRVGIRASGYLIKVGDDGTGRSNGRVLGGRLDLGILLSVLFNGDSRRCDSLCGRKLVSSAFSFSCARRRNFKFTVINKSAGSPSHLTSALRGVLLSTERGKTVSRRALSQAGGGGVNTFLHTIGSPRCVTGRFAQCTFGRVSLFSIIPALRDVALRSIRGTTNRLVDRRQFAIYRIIPGGWGTISTRHRGEHFTFFKDM